MKRRNFLKSSSLGLSPLVFSGCTATSSVVASQSKVGAVQVAENRVIGHLSALRPYRPQGFRIEAERFGDKYLVHNYGHGGCGVTLCWGSGMEAADLVQPLAGQAGSEIAVIGAGVIGLTSARILQERGYRVTIYADKLPPYTTSNVAGALWAATTIADEDAYLPDFPERIQRIIRQSFNRFTKQLGSRYGVRFIDCYNVGFGEANARKEPWTYALTPELFPGKRTLSAADNPFPADFGSVYDALHIDPDIFLRQLVDDLYTAGGNIQFRRFKSAVELIQLPQSVIVNCTGMGAAQLMEDRSLTPIKGQLVSLLPQDDVDYVLFSPAGYLMRRSNSIVLGGSMERGNWDSSVDMNLAENIMQRHRDFFARMKP